MKLVHVIGALLVMAGIQMSASERSGLEWDERSESPTLSDLSVDSDSQEPGMDRSLGRLGNLLRTSGQEDSDNDADPTIDSSDDEMTADEFVKGLEKACDEIASSNMQEDINSKDSYKRGLRFTKKSLIFLEQRKKELLSDEYEGLKNRLERLKEQIEDIGEQHGWKKKSAATPQSLGQSERDKYKEQIDVKREASLDRDRRMERFAKLVVGGTIATLAVVAAVIWYYYKKPAAVR